MKLTILVPCTIRETARTTSLYVGDTVDLPDSVAAKLLAPGWAEPYHSAEEAANGAPPREKAAARRAPDFN